jgi:hypothetical protein
MDTRVGFAWDYRKRIRHANNEDEMERRSENWYVVEEILGHEYEKGNYGKDPKVWYLVSFVGYSALDNVLIKQKHFNELETLKKYQLANGIKQYERAF